MRERVKSHKGQQAWRSLHERKRESLGTDVWHLIFKSSGVVLCVILGGELMPRVLLQRLWQLFYIFICLWNPELITRHVHRMEWLVFGPKSNSSKTTKEDKTLFSRTQADLILKIRSLFHQIFSISWFF